MFTGIIESQGKVIEKRHELTNVHFRIQSDISPALKIDQSIAHDGVCLTVVAVGSHWHEVTAVQETLSRTNLLEKEVGDAINLERAMHMNQRLDGHMVQGHVDTLAYVREIANLEGSHLFTFSCQDDQLQKLIVPKGSIAVNGVSLTVVDPRDDEFSVAIIPYTYDHTTFHALRIGHPVNIEYDIIGKYVARQLAPFAKHTS